MEGGQPDGFVASLTSEEIDDLLARGVRRQFRRGAFIFTEGDSSDHVVFVLAGRVKVSSFTAEGKEVVLAVRGPGELLGEFSALDGEPRMASVSAVEAVEVLVLPADRFELFLQDHARLAVMLLRSVIRKLREAERQRVEFGAYDAAGRVARRLVELVTRFGLETEQGVQITLALSQEELAGWTGSSREAVSKALRTFRDRGWIETKRRQIVVIDPQALRERAE